MKTSKNFYVNNNGQCDQTFTMKFILQIINKFSVKVTGH